MLLSNFSRFKLPLPKDILSEGDHHVLVDATGQYFGIVAQKKSSFLDQSMLKSARTQELAKSNASLARMKFQMSEKFDDEEQEAEYCRKRLQAFEEKKSQLDKHQLEAQKAWQKRTLFDQVYEEIDEDVYDDEDEDVGPTTTSVDEMW